MIKQTETRPHVIRFVIVKKAKNDPYFTMVAAQQGRYTYTTREEALKALDSLYQSNNKETLERFAPNAKIAECACYPSHFDPMQYAFE